MLECVLNYGIKSRQLDNNYLEIALTMEEKSSKSSMSAGDNASTSGKKSTSPSGKSGKSEKSPKKSSSSKKEDDMLITIDLTDPQDLMRKMEMIDFTDEEADELLKQAMEVNKMLKKELEKHEYESLRKSFSRAVTISSTTGERTSGLMVLPPVDSDGKTNLASLNFSKVSFHVKLRILCVDKA